MIRNKELVAVFLLLCCAPAFAATPAVFQVKFETTQGDFIVEVHRDWAPVGAGRFLELVKAGYYDGNRFFRVIKGFVVQFGLNGDPTITSHWKPLAIKDDPVKESNKKGAITFATAGPNTRTTQVFINLGDNTRLDSMGFAPFGAVTEGMEVVEKLLSEYGNSPDQDKITSRGNSYLEANFPRLDSIKGASLVPAAKNK